MAGMRVLSKNNALFGQAKCGIIFVKDSVVCIFGLADHVPGQMTAILPNIWKSEGEKLVS